MEAKKLSDNELYALVMNKELSDELKALVDQEFESRSYSVQQLDALGMNYKKATEKQTKPDLSVVGKIVIVLFPFWILFQSIIASRHIAKDAKNKWQQHWNLMAIGYFLWLITLLFMLKLFRTS